MHAAQWGRRMTTSVRKFARHDTYLSFYIPMAYVIGAAAGHLTPMYPTTGRTWTSWLAMH